MRPFSKSRNPLWLILPLLLAACDPGGSVQPEPEPSEPDISWLQEKAIPFGTTAPGGSTADLAPLGAMIGGARIVGLGEATHGSREFFEMKHRIIEYLVRERGFRTFGIEATWAEALRINRYVHTGEGDPAVLLSNLYFWTWNTQEVLDLILWMRAYNQTAPAGAKVSFYGFDLQASRVAMDDVEAYLLGVDPAARDLASAHYACFRLFEDQIGKPRPNYTAAPPATKQQCQDGVRAAYALVEAKAAEYVPLTGSEAYDTALRTARVVVQNEAMRGSPDLQGFWRDTYMAENAAWLAEHSGGAGVVLWAHNAHVSRWHPFMGAHLAQLFGAGYVPVGFSFHQGGLNAVLESAGGLREQTAPPAAPESYEHQFNRLGHARFMVDLRPLRGAGIPAGADWLRGPRPFRLIGALYRSAGDAQYYGDHSLPAEYDLMIHLSHVTATRLLPFRYE